MSNASTIERFRKRFHGQAFLRLLTLADDGQRLWLSRTVTRGFYIGREYDTGIGAYVSYLTIDTGLSHATDLELAGMAYVDVVEQSGEFQRHSINTGTPPQIEGDRYVFQVEAAFDNTLPIGGVISYNPDDPTPVIDPEFHRFLFEQLTPATEWIINHNLGEWPVIELFSVGGLQINADVANLTVNQIRVSFNTPVAGRARCI